MKRITSFLLVLLTIGGITIGFSMDKTFKAKTQLNGTTEIGEEPITIIVEIGKRISYTIFGKRHTHCPGESTACVSVNSVGDGDYEIKEYDWDGNEVKKYCTNTEPYTYLDNETGETVVVYEDKLCQ